MRKADLDRHKRQPSDTFNWEELADELVSKGVFFLGAGLGLYVALAFFGEKSPKK